MVKSNRATSDNVLHACIVVLMALLTIVFLYPLWDTFVRSFSSARTANSAGFKFWPTEFTTDAYAYALRNPDILVALRNTVFRTVVGTALTVTITFLGGYGLSRRNLPGRSYITFFIVLTMFINAGLVPTYLNIRSLGLVGTVWAWLLPSLTSAWNLVICRNFVMALPYELEECAMIDGAHPLHIIFRILLPLSAPILAVLTLWSAVGQWNSWFDAMIYTNKPELTVLQLVVRRMIISTSVDESNVLATSAADITSTTLKSATIMITTLPIILLYPFLQKHFVKGVMVGALKG
jgi:putative aldouronate transport system permease protein